jgi:hypothetical protein
LLLSDHYFLLLVSLLANASPRRCSDAARPTGTGHLGQVVCCNMSKHHTLSLSFEDRASLPNTSPLASYLLHLIAIKRSNLCLSADVSTTAELLALAEEVGNSICLLKTHADIINDFSERTVRELREIAKKKRFLVFEDRKFGDIGSELAVFLLFKLCHSLCPFVLHFRIPCAEYAYGNRRYLGDCRHFIYLLPCIS